jgi:hypothetical protein
MQSLYESILSSTKSGYNKIRLVFSKEYTKSNLDKIIGDFYNFYKLDKRNTLVEEILQEKIDSCKSVNFISIAFLEDKDAKEKLLKATQAAYSEKEFIEILNKPNYTPIVFRMKYKEGNSTEEYYDYYPKLRTPFERYNEYWSYRTLNKEILKGKELI